MKIAIEKGDLLKIADKLEFKQFALAHCISEDCAMGKGIATEFKKRFKGIPDLKKQVKEGKKTGTAALLMRDRPVYYLITKKTWRNFPTYDSLQSSLEDMRTSLTEKNVPGVLMPKIGCGLDKLEWSKVTKLIDKVFEKTDIKVIVCLRE